YMREEVDVMPQLQIAKPDFSSSKPLFETPTNGALLQPEPVAAEPVAEEPKKPVEASANGNNKVKALRQLCLGAKIPETMLLGFLAEIGSIEPGMQGLEELAIKAPNVLNMAYDQFADIAAKINEARGVK